MRRDRRELDGRGWLVDGIVSPQALKLLDRTHDLLAGDDAGGQPAVRLRPVLAEAEWSPLMLRSSIAENRYFFKSAAEI
jgi:hypothetical protein